MKRIIPALLGGVLLVSHLPAQEPASRKAADSAFSEAYARGDRLSAIAAGAAALKAMCATVPTGAAEEEAGALLLRLAPIGLTEPTAFLSALDGLAAEGSLAAMISAHRRMALTALGRYSEARDEARKFGHFESWLLAGPFDNERGQGFRSVSEPEKSPVDPNATFDGKDRKIGWRTADAAPASGLWNLGDFVTPREQVLVFLAAVVTAERPGRVHLGVGSSGPIAVFLNGTQVFRSDIKRDGAFDQDFAPLDLQAGPNELLVKLGVEQGAFVATLRLADISGGPMPTGVRVSANPGAFSGRRIPLPAPEGTATKPGGDAAAAVPAKDADVSAPIGFAARCLAAAALPDADAAVLFRASAIRIGLRLDDLAKPSTSELTARLLKLLPDDAAARERHATALRRSVRIAAERADNSRLVALEAVLAVRPDHVPALLELARTALEELNQPEEARRRIAAALKAAPGNAAAHSFRARMLDAEGRSAEAETDLALAASGGGYLAKAAFARRLMQRGRTQDGLARMAEARAAAPGERSILESLGGAAQAKGDLATAASLVQSMLELAPSDWSARVRLVGLAEARQDFAGALAACEDGLKFDPDRPEILTRAALQSDRLEKRDAALDYVRRALVVTPGDAALRRYEGRLAGQEQAFEDFYPVDVAAVAKAAPDFADNPDNRAVRVLASRRIVKANPDGTVSDFRQDVVQILSQQGAEEYDTVYVSFAGGDERARIKSARLFRPGEAAVEAARSGSFAADFPPLRPGDVVEWAFRTDDLRPSFFGNYIGVRHPFQGGSLPETMSSELVLLLPKSREFRFHVRHADLKPETIAAPPFLAGYDARRYAVGRLPAVASEPAMPGAEEFVPEAQVSTYVDWDAFAGWWWNLVKEQFDVNDAMRAKLAEILAGKTADDEKIAAVYALAVTDIRYVAWPFGVHGYKPYRASAIYERRFGDCKDKALLICAMLKEVGIVAHPVIIRSESARPNEDLSLALVEHFNHCIAAIPTADGGFRFLDGTAEFHAVSDVPDSDRGAKVVVVRDGRATLAQVPHARPEENAERERMKVKLAADGGAEIEFDSDVAGRDAVRTRSAFVNESDRKEVLSRELNARFGAGELGTIRASKLDDLSAPVRFGWTFAVKDALVRDGEKARLKPFWPSFDWTTLGAAPERRFDLVLGEPFLTETEVEIDLGGRKLTGFPRDVVLETTFAEYRLVREETATGLVMKRRLMLKTPRVAAADYAAFKAFVNQVAAADAETAVTTTEAAR